MQIKWSARVAAVITLLLASTVHASRFLPGIVTIGNKYDNGFFELVYSGADRFKKEFDTPYLEIQVENDAQYEQAVRGMARRGADPVVAVGRFAAAVRSVARDYPKTRFVLIDEIIPGKNVMSIKFREQEGSFLVGMAAAMKSQTHTIGFIGSIGIPLVRSFACGYIQGARFINPKIKVIQNMAGATAKAALDPARGMELARSQFDRGVDVVFTAANLTSLGVLQQAKQSGKLAIGIDSNQNGLQPGSILTSMLKRVDNVVYGVLLDAKQGRWKPGMKSVGLKENAVGWALDEHNRALITPEMEQRINQARANIIAGKIKVVDYRTHQSCPVK